MTGAAIDLGDVPTWIGALGTVSAFFIALIIYGRSVRDRRKDQARRVSGWIPGGPTIIPAGMLLGQSPKVASVPTIQIMIHIHNGSDELISDVSATPVAADGSDLGVAPTHWTDIGPLKDVELTSFFPDTGTVRGEMRLRLEFTDAVGQRWTRLGGDLHRT